jgi:hypothetical protein
MLSTNTKEGLTCFIVVPLENDISAVVSSMSRRGVKCRNFNWFDLGISPPLLRDALTNSDFVCVISPAPPPPNLWFELGVAVGLRKPIFMVAEEDFLNVSGFRFVTFVKGREWNPDVVEPHLDAFLQTLPPQHTARERGSRKRPDRLRRVFDAERRQLQALATRPDGRLVAVFVQSLFQKAQFNVTTAPLEDYGADMAVWSPEIRQKLGSPILVEIKASPLFHDHAWGIKRLSDLLVSGRGSVGVYVIGDAAVNRAALVESRAPVLVTTIAGLIDLLEGGQFIDAARDARNKVVHGRDF